MGGARHSFLEESFRKSGLLSEEWQWYVRVAGQRWERKNHSQVNGEERERMKSSGVEEGRGGKEQF